MPKTRDAFALRDFKLLEFLEKKAPKFKPPKNDDKDRIPGFRLWRYEISLYYKHINFLTTFQKRIIRHNNRLAKYQSKLVKKIAIVRDEKEYSEISAKSQRVVDLSDKYTAVAKDIVLSKNEYKRLILLLEKALEKQILEEFAERLKELRQKAGLTQTQLAENLGTTQKIISFYETSRSVPSIQALIALSLEFDCSTDWLLGLNN